MTNLEAVVIGSTIGTLPLMESLNKQRISYELIGHSRLQMGAFIAPAFTEVHYRNTQSFYTLLDERFSQNFNLKLIPGTHDLCYRVYVEYLASRGKLLQSDASLAENIHNKRLFRHRLRELAASHCPRFVDFSEASRYSDISFPAIYKPDHAGGGRGITLLQTEDELRRFLLSIDPHEGGIFEEFIEGRLYSVSVWLKNSRMWAFSGQREFIENGKFRVNASVVSNEILDDLDASKIPEELTGILLEFGLTDGFAHTQIIRTDSQRWYIVEIMLRLPGDMYSYPIEVFSNFPYSEMYISAFPPERHGAFPSSVSGRFPDNAVYGRLIQRPGSSSLECIEPFASFNSHISNQTDSYKIQFFRDQNIRKYNQLESLFV
jgi:hypothetical protein